MNTTWMIQTHGDPLNAVQKFVQDIWKHANLDEMVVSIDGKGVKGHLLDDPAQLDKINPFRPLMVVNTAKLVLEIQAAHPQERQGVLLRPCELRALNEMAARGAIRTNRLLTICVDCLGTFPEDEFQWRSVRKGSAKGLDKEALQFAPQGGISAYRYRAACQMCTSSGATEADVNIGVLGLPVRQVMLINVKDGELDWKTITDGPADPALTAKRELMLAKLTERYSRTRERVISGLMQVLPANVDALLDQFEACGNCRTCMDSCPICAAEYPRQGQDGRFLREDVINWLASCAGCGMCEQACPRNLPLSIIFTHVRQEIDKTLVL